MKSTYRQEDVLILLKDITGKLPLLDNNEREKRIQSGVHYSEMIPLEYVPSKEYMNAYNFALNNMSRKTADAVCNLSENIFSKKGRNVVLVSLARAGIPAGILVKRYIKNKYSNDIAHYAISIIRDKGIDENALNYILSKHNAADIQFIDGWIGKGTIARELQKFLAEYEAISTDLAAISDPCGISDTVGTFEDLLIPSALLNSVVTGLISRTVLNDSVISKNDFHGAAYYGEFEKNDLSNAYLDKIESYFDYNKQKKQTKPLNIAGVEIVKNLADILGIDDINFIKPGIGEATRVLLRRKPEVMLINKDYAASDELSHLYTLAKERGVECKISPAHLGAYKAVGIIKKLKDL